MKTRLAPIGNSQAIVIPKRILEQTGLRGEVEVSVKGNCLVIRPARKPRQGWAAALRKMAQRGEDALLDEATRSLSRWDETKWEWEQVAFRLRSDARSEANEDHPSQPFCLQELQDPLQGDVDAVGVVV